MAITAAMIGAESGAGDRQANFLKVFIGEVISAFQTKNVGMDLIKVKTISSGKTAQFVASGAYLDTDVLTHTPGADISTTDLNFGTVDISINDRIYLSNLIDKFEEKLSHYNARSEISKQMGEAMAIKADKAIFAKLEVAMTATGIVGRAGGSTITNTVIASGSTAAAKGDALIAAIFEANAALNLRNVTGDRYFITDSTNYYNLVQSSNGVNQFYTNSNGGIDEGKIMEIGGTKILWSNNLPATANLEGFVFTEGAIGMVKFMDITTEYNYIPLKLADLVTTYMAYGLDVVDPACVVGIKSL
jgi:hypothetical protein